MSNELTIITFYGAEDENIPPVTPDQVAEITAAMSGVYTQAATIVGFSVEMRLTFAAPPRKGSLELAFLHTLDVVSEMANEGRATSFTDIQHEISNALKDWAGVAAFLYTVVFGGRGLVDLTLYDRNQSSPIPYDNDDLRNRTVEIISKNGKIRTEIKRLQAVAAIRSVDMVQVRVLDCEPVTIYTTQDRFDTKVLARAGGKKLPMQTDKINEPSVGLEFKAVGTAISANWDDRPSAVLIAEAQGNRNILIWNSTQRLPKEGETFFARVHRPDNARFQQALKVSEAIPPDFENAVDIYLVGPAFFQE